MKEELQTLLQRRESRIMLVTALEASLARAKEDLREVEEVEIPELFEREGIESMALADGSEISVPQFYRANIPKENKEEFFNWMDENGYGELAPTCFMVDFNAQDADARGKLREAAEELGKTPVLERSIHNKTLTAWVKRQFESGSPLPDSLKTYTGKKVKITKQ